MGWLARVECCNGGILAFQERQGKKITKGELPFMWENNWNAWSSA